jgi:hypothetical protein
VIRPNYSLENDVAGRAFGGPTNPFKLFHMAVQLNFAVGEATTAQTKLAAIPSGNSPPVTWIPPFTAGGLAARREIAGAGAIVPFALLAGRNIEAALEGTGAIASVGELIILLEAALSGSGALTAQAEAFLQLAAALSGTGDVAGAINALAHAVAAIVGTGNVDATIKALGSLEAALVVTGTGLSTANVGEAVWNYLVESGYTAVEAQRILLAVAAGKTSGVGSSEMTFRDVNDTTDRVVGTLDGSGNRTAVTLAAS